MPRFSIVIPTRNRASLLRFALQSALDQNFADYEVIVSNNCSTDDTKDVVNALGKDRVRYFQPPEVLSMPDHWEWALQHVSGKFVLLLCDDEAVSSECLASAERVIQDRQARIVVLGNGFYVHPSWPVEHERNVLISRVFSGAEIECQSRKVLEDLFARLWSVGLPLAHNSVCDMDIIKTVQKRTGRFFHQPVPDISACCLMLTIVPWYVFLDEPLILHGRAKESIGASYAHFRNSQSSEEFRKEFKEAIFQLSPIRCHCVTSMIVESILRAQAALPEGLESFRVNEAEFYISCLRDIEQLERNGVDVSQDRRELTQYRKKLGLSFQLSLMWAVAREAIGRSPLGPLARAIKHSLVRRPAIPLSDINRTVFLRGEDFGFTNILECARRLPELRIHLCSGKPPYIV